MTELPRPVLLYDAECRFCRWSARAARRLDRREAVALLPLQDPAAAPLLAGVPAEDRLESVRLAEPGGALLDRGPAVVALLRVLGLPIPRFAGPLLTPLYDAVSSERGRLARFVPQGPAPRAFP
jgi:predicted DCC family thiol-disulfide oxidoreductase YuxK